MKPNISTITTTGIIVASLMAAGILVCLKTGVNCRGLFRPRNCIVEHMKRMEPSFKGDVNKAPGKDEAAPCSGPKRQVFVDWRRVYWGNLGELTKPDGFFAPHKSVETVVMENPVVAKNDVLRLFTMEIRAALKAFEKRYGVKVNWRKKDLAMPDVTAQFITFWDRDFGRMEDTQHTSQEEKTERRGQEK